MAGAASRCGSSKPRKWAPCADGAIGLGNGPLSVASEGLIRGHYAGPASPTGQVGSMTYVVTEVCIKCKYMDCVEVCPVDCFYEGENMLVIHPDECIDCGVCEPECPVDAIKPDTEPALDRWLDLNRQYSETWPNITTKKPAPPDADAFVSEPDKFAKYFSPAPGEGD